jgi:HNH endonuclease
MSLSWADTVRQLEARAGQRCEYCLMHQALQGDTFHVEHIIPSSANDPDDLSNLAWACPGCNLKKSNRLSATDPDTEKEVPLFHPHTQRWQDHFAWVGHCIIGRTAVGRATVAAFDLNHPRRQLIREAEEYFDFFPP